MLIFFWGRVRVRVIYITMYVVLDCIVLIGIKSILIAMRMYSKTILKREATLFGHHRIRTSYKDIIRMF